MSGESRPCSSIRRKRKSLTLEERVQVIQLSKTGEKAINIAKFFEVGKTQIQCIIHDQKDIMQRWKDGDNADRKYKAMKCKYDLINNRLFHWFCEIRSQNVPVSGKTLKDKATEIAAETGYDDFSASNGWLARWLKRNNIQSITLYSETVDLGPDVLEDWLKGLSKLCEGYSPCDIFCASETSLFFRAMPSKSMVTKKESTSGIQTAKDRITLLIAANAAGQKLEPVVIGNSMNPSCFYGKDIHDLGVHYFHNEESWMTPDIFTTWLAMINNRMLLADRKIILFVDHSAVHAPIQPSHIKIVMVPPNTKAKLQPCDAGVIQTIKQCYRRRLLNHILLQMDGNDNISGPELAQNINLLDAVQWLKSAVNSLQSSMISKCFQICGFSTPGPLSDIPESPESETKINYDRLFPYGLTFAEFASFDDDIPTFSSFTDTSRTIYLEKIKEEKDDDYDYDDNEYEAEETEKIEPVIDDKTAALYARELVKFAVARENMQLAQTMSVIQADIEESCGK